MLGSAWSNWCVAPFKGVIVEFGDVPGSGVSEVSYYCLEVGDQILR